MNNVLGERVVNCSTCKKAVAVSINNESNYECELIRLMGIKTKHKHHAAHQIMVCNDKIYVPKCCPISTTEKIGEYY